MNSLQRKEHLLGMSYGKANHRLMKSILFHLVQQCGRDACYRCGKKILSVSEFSIEHTNPWQRSEDPVVTFFDVTAISFSHRLCNFAAAEKTTKRFASRKDCQTAYQPRRNEISRRRYDPEVRRARYQKYGY